MPALPLVDARTHSQNGLFAKIGNHGIGLRGSIEATCDRPRFLYPCACLLQGTRWVLLAKRRRKDRCCCSSLLSVFWSVLSRHAGWCYRLPSSTSLSLSVSLSPSINRKNFHRHVTRTALTGFSLSLSWASFSFFGLLLLLFLLSLSLSLSWSLHERFSFVFLPPGRRGRTYPSGVAKGRNHARAVLLFSAKYSSPSSPDIAPLLSPLSSSSSSRFPVSLPPAVCRIPPLLLTTTLRKPDHTA